MSNQKPRRALITGITGQDGAYLSELLLEKGYEVHGIKRRSSLFNTSRIDHLIKDEHEPDARLFLHHGDLTDGSNLIRILQETQPDEIYNLAAMSHVHVSFDTPEYTGNADALGTLRLLEAIRILKMEARTRIYHASTSELYGKVQAIPQDETTPFYPRSPYGVAKLYAFWITKNYREAYGIFGCNGILFNHESPRRGETFVTRKITRAVTRIALGVQPSLYLGNLDAQRDWGHARDYVRAMWMMLQHHEADDYVVATGQMMSVRTFVEQAFARVGISLSFSGKGVDEVGVIAAIDKARLEAATLGMGQATVEIGQQVVKVDSYYYRPTEVDQLLGNPAKIKRVLGWEAQVLISELIHEMVDADMLEARREIHLKTMKV